MYTLTVKSADDALLAKLAADVRKLLQSYETVGRDGHMKRGAALALHSVKVERA